MRYVTPSQACAYAYIDPANNVRFRNNGINIAPHKPVPRGIRRGPDGAITVVCFLNMRDFFLLVSPSGQWDAEALRSVEISPNAPIGALHPARLPFMDWCPTDLTVRGDYKKPESFVHLRNKTIVRIYTTLHERMDPFDALKETAARFSCTPRSLKTYLKGVYKWSDKRSEKT